MCDFCGRKIYIKTIQYAAPILAPLTRAEELRQQLHNLTGEIYVEFEPIYCPMCGAKLAELRGGE